LADLGLGSRRAVEDWIRAGRLTVNGRTAALGDRAAPGDDVRLDGRRLELPRAASAPRQLLLYYKPPGEVTTRHDPEGRPTVFERLPQPLAGRWITVGRLDVNTSGLLLLTTDGELAHRLMHPSSEVAREYLVRVRGRPGPGVLRRLLAGVRLEDGPARFDAVAPADEGPEGDSREGGSHASFRVSLHEGRNREVRRLFEAVGFEVSRLLRIRYGPVELPRDMRPGQARLADAALLARLDRLMPPAPPAPAPAADPPATPKRPLRGGLRHRPPSK
jgi:23S rRNA pseudouridine2605 synthase